MRYAIISDIHSNREALEAVLRKIETLKTDKTLCLGDVVGYNADPGFCVETIRAVSSAVVRGNHDKAVAGLMNVAYFNSHAAEAVRWTSRALDAAALAYVKSLPPGPLAPHQTPSKRQAAEKVTDWHLVRGGILLCHGAPQDEDLYLTSAAAIDEAFACIGESHAGTWVCFFGHTHVPLAIDNQENILNTEGAVFLEKDRLYLINPGSVGQPRDNNPDAAFGVWDDEDCVFTFYRVPFAVRETQSKILEAGLPPILAHRLQLGR